MDVDDAQPGVPEDIEALRRQPVVWDEPPADFEDTMLAGLRRERDDAAGRPAAPQPAGRRFWARRELLVAAAAVLVVLAGTVVGIRVLSGDDDSGVQHVALVGTDLAPQASGSAEIVSRPSGFQVTLHVENLAPAPRGTYYQAWLKNAAGELVTIGTFHARHGPDAIVLWSGVDPGHYDTLTVTLQKQGAGAESSGQVVLAGPLS